MQGWTLSFLDTFLQPADFALRSAPAQGGPNMIVVVATALRRNADLRVTVSLLA